MYYLDNAATTMPSEEVINAVTNAMKNKSLGNPGSIHDLGFAAHEAVESARKTMADFFGCDTTNVIFTSGGTESNNIAIKGLTDYLLRTGRNHIIVSAVEHDSVLRAVESLKPMFEVTVVPVTNRCQIALNELLGAFKDNTGLVCAMYVNNETGAVNDVDKISRMCHERNVLFHCDCVQAVGVVDLNVDKIGCDSLSISGHKFFGPKGIGALYLRNPKLYTPLITGGEYQEFGLRGGTENLYGIIGLEEAVKHVNDINPAQISETTRRFSSELIDKIGGDNVIVNECGGTKIVSVRFVGTDSETMLAAMNSVGIYASAGSACQSHESKPSHVLKAMGLSDDASRETVRFSFSKPINEERISIITGLIRDCYNLLVSMYTNREGVI